MKWTITLIAAAMLYPLTSSCGGLDMGRKDNYYSVNADGSRSQRYSMLNQYTAYGRGTLGAQERISKAYENAQHAPPPLLEVEVLNASLPPGVSLDGGVVKIEPGAPYIAIGRYEIGYWLGSAPPESDVGDDLRRLAAVTGGNVVVVEIKRLRHGDLRVSHMNGIVLRRYQPVAEPAPAPDRE